MISERRRKAWVYPLSLPLLLLGAVGLAYVNAFWGAFQFDDYNVIVDNQSVHSWSGWWADAPRGIRPLLKATYVFNWTSGWSLFGFHLVNLAIHALNVLLVYVLSRKFLTDRAVLSADSAPSAALLAGLLFALHPVQTEAVTYISGRSTSLMTLFYLGSLWAYIRGTETESTRWLYGISPVLFACSLASKEVAVTLPAALLLWELTGAREQASWNLILRRQALHWLLLVAGIALLLVHPRYEWLLTFGLGVRSVGDNVLTQIHGVAYLLSHLVWLHELNIDPDLPVLTHWTLKLIVEAGGLLLLLGLGLANFRRRPWLAFGILWFFLHLLPTNSILPRLDVANERQLYLPGWGLYLAFSVALLMLLEQSGLSARSLQAWPDRVALGRCAATVGLLSLALLLACFTIARNHTYRSEVALWEDAAAKSPLKARVYNNLGYAYFLAGRSTEARESYQTALRLDPRFELASNNLAVLSSHHP